MLNSTSSPPARWPTHLELRRLWEQFGIIDTLELQIYCEIPRVSERVRPEITETPSTRFPCPQKIVPMHREEQLGSVPGPVPKCETRVWTATKSPCFAPSFHRHCPALVLVTAALSQALVAGTSLLMWERDALVKAWRLQASACTSKMDIITALRCPAWMPSQAGSASKTLGEAAMGVLVIVISALEAPHTQSTNKTTMMRNACTYAASQQRQRNLSF